MVGCVKIWLLRNCAVSMKVLLSKYFLLLMSLLVVSFCFLSRLCVFIVIYIKACLDPFQRLLCKWLKANKSSGSFTICIHFLTTISNCVHNISLRLKKQYILHIFILLIYFPPPKNIYIYKQCWSISGHHGLLVKWWMSVAKRTLERRAVKRNNNILLNGNQQKSPCQPLFQFSEICWYQ